MPTQRASEREVRGGVDVRRVHLRPLAIYAVGQPRHAWRKRQGIVLPTLLHHTERLATRPQTGADLFAVDGLVHAHQVDRARGAHASGRHVDGGVRVGDNDAAERVRLHFVVRPDALDLEGGVGDDAVNLRLIGRRLLLHHEALHEHHAAKRGLHAR